MGTEPAHRTLKVLVSIRVVFISALLAAFVVLRLDYHLFPYPRLILYLIAAIYALNIGYLLVLTRTRLPADLQGYVQLVLDAVIIVLLTMATGGIESWFSVTMLLAVIAASMTLGRRAGFIIATLSGLLYGAAVDLQFYRIIPVAYSSSLSEKNFFFNITLYLLALYLTAYLTGHLTAGLERARQRLDEKSTDLAQLSLFHRDVIENIPSGLFYIDQAGAIRLFNSAAEHITGIPRERAEAMNIQEIFPFIATPPGPGRFMDMAEIAGARKHVGMSISRHKDRNGADLGFIGTFQDLTEVVRLENEVKRREKFAALGEMSANIAHEIRNPLASIKGSIEMIREQRVREADRERLMEIALREIARLNTIITDFLNYANPRPLAFRAADVAALLSGTVVLLRSSFAGESSVRFDERISRPLVADVDEDRLRQVFWNLLANAVEAVGDEGTVAVRAWQEDGHIIAEITDTGPGIDREDMDRIFYPFYTTKKNGTGLGLAIAYRIIEEHHGSIHVKSTPGEGASFMVRLPVARRPAPTP